MIQKVVLSESARSTMSETLSDWSGAPLKEIHKMKSKNYKRSDPYAQKFYDLNKLEVQEKFPREDFLWGPLRPMPADELKVACCLTFVAKWLHNNWTWRRSCCSSLFHSVVFMSQIKFFLLCVTKRNFRNPC